MITKASKLKPTHAGAVVLRESNSKIEVLLAKRVGGKVPGFFLTQGHIEEDETPVAAAKREIIEETGIQNATLIDDLGILIRKGLAEDGQWYRRTIHFFLFRVPREEKSEWTTNSPDNKTFQLKFVPTPKAKSLLFFKEEKNFLQIIARCMGRRLNFGP